MAKSASKHLKRILRRKRPGKVHLICGGGGTRAVLGCTGSILALNKHGLQKYETAGGISGGAIPTLLIAAGFTPKQMLKLAVKMDYSELLTKKVRRFKVFRRYLMQKKNERFPLIAILASKRLGDFLEELVPTWPETFWTMACADVDGLGRCQILFTSQGVFQYDENGNCTQLSDTPAPVGLAIRASCAVPGLIEPIEYKGLVLYDGMLSWDGRTPIGIVTKHFKTHPRNIVALDVGSGKSLIPGFEQRYMNWWCGQACFNGMTLEEWAAKGVAVVVAPITAFGSLKLDLTKNQKRAALKKGFKAVEKAAQEA